MVDSSSIRPAGAVGDGRPSRDMPASTSDVSQRFDGALGDSRRTANSGEARIDVSARSLRSDGDAGTMARRAALLTGEGAVGAGRAGPEAASSAALRSALGSAPTESVGTLRFGSSLMTLMAFKRFGREGGRDPAMLASLTHTLRSTADAARSGFMSVAGALGFGRTAATAAEITQHQTAQMAAQAQTAAQSQGAAGTSQAAAQPAVILAEPVVQSTRADAAQAQPSPLQTAQAHLIAIPLLAPSGLSLIREQTQTDAPKDPPEGAASLEPNGLGATHIALFDDRTALLTGPEVDVLFGEVMQLADGIVIALTGGGTLRGREVIAEPVAERAVLVLNRLDDSDENVHRYRLWARISGESLSTTATLDVK